MWLFGSSNAPSVRKKDKKLTVQQMVSELKRLTTYHPTTTHPNTLGTAAATSARTPYIISDDIQLSTRPVSTETAIGGVFDPRVPPRGWGTIRVEDKNVDAVVECLRGVAELLVHDDNHMKINSENTMHEVLELSLLPFVVSLLYHPQVQRPVKVQILQTVSICFQNINSETTLFSMMSGSAVSDLIQCPFDLFDDEVLSYLVSLLRALAFKLSERTAPFFCNKHNSRGSICFPLFLEGAKLFTHREGMARTTVQSLLLSIFQVRDRCIQQFILDRGILFTYMACYIKELWLRVERVARGLSARNLSTLLEEHDEFLLFLEDILRLKPSDTHTNTNTHTHIDTPTDTESDTHTHTQTETNPYLRVVHDVLLHRMFEYAFFPILINPLITHTHTHTHKFKLKQSIKTNPPHYPNIFTDTQSIL
eukprot:GHVR01041558.1.p1 GENE.GHVR01041558.1~~GHVR01041558.1.p1  ORF type:complete len:422 (-),score=119.81 GHVR01041558.1:503-1768(-)